MLLKAAKEKQRSIKSEQQQLLFMFKYYSPGQDKLEIACGHLIVFFSGGARKRKRKPGPVGADIPFITVIPHSSFEDSAGVDGGSVYANAVTTFAGKIQVNVYD